MRQLIRKLTDRARAFSSSGRHRRGCLLPRVPPQACRRTKPGISVAPTVRAWYESIDGTANALVRPYLAAYECDERAHLQWLRHDTSWRATYDVARDPQDIHTQLGAA